MVLTKIPVRNTCLGSNVLTGPNYCPNPMGSEMGTMVHILDIVIPYRCTYYHFNQKVSDKRENALHGAYMPQVYTPLVTHGGR